LPKHQPRGDKRHGEKKKTLNETIREKGGQGKKARSITRAPAADRHQETQKIQRRASLGKLATKKKKNLAAEATSNLPGSLKTLGSGKGEI